MSKADIQAIQEIQAPKVSVVIPFYNCPYVQQAIESVLSQTYPHIELILVDDGSTRHTELLAPYMDRIRYFRKENGGTATALNEGLRRATGDYFCWLSSDDVFAPWKTEEQLRFMQQMNAEISCTKFNVINQEGTIIAYNNGLDPIKEKLFLQKMMQGCFVHGCTVMAKMSLLREAGEFDETLKYAHDYDLWMRIALRVPFHIMDMTLINYRMHDQMGTIQFSKEQQQEAKLVQQQYRQAVQDRIEALE
ncbi:glycosyltransferase [Paenibacillus pinistramenti]|uniref:glycosyltransferase n=1 Tax=Paenibacillus pinistramenti TaxID=1768003 RepID=UPI001EEFE35D|nr:glycosyltransferase [Paenibacillus pinistramenti]